jgi:tripartite-type tricarboxylate transporter receptor subunit TctC
VFGRPPSFTRDQFAPIALVSADPSMLFVNAKTPWKDFNELIADARKRPGQIVYASGGLYGTTHLAVEIVLKATGTKMRHLPTAGGGPSLTAVLGNHAQLLAAHPAVGGPQARAGVLRPMGTLGTKRVASFPDIPTLKELGYDAQYYQWNGLFTQAKVPEPIIKIWREAVAKAVKDPEFIKAMEKVGSGIEYLDRDAFRPWWDEDSRKTEEAVRAIGKVQ